MNRSRRFLVIAGIPGTSSVIRDEAPSDSSSTACASGASRARHQAEVRRKERQATILGWVGLGHVGDGRVERGNQVIRRQMEVDAMRTATHGDDR